MPDNSVKYYTELPNAPQHCVVDIVPQSMGRQTHRRLGTHNPTEAESRAGGQSAGGRTLVHLFNWGTAVAEEDRKLFEAEMVKHAFDGVGNPARTPCLLGGDHGAWSL